MAISSRRSGPIASDAGRERTDRIARLGPLGGLLASYQDWNWGWRFDTALRYRPVVSRIARLPESVSILEVGCGNKGGITSYSGREAIGVDITFDPGRLRRHRRLRPVCASGDALPFPSRSFDVVVCLDMIEHIPGGQRPGVLHELARVARDTGLLVVGAPCGPASREAEELVAREYLKRTGRPHPKLAEHLSHDPIDCGELSSAVEQAATRAFGSCETAVLGNVNLDRWIRYRRLFDLGRPVPGASHVQRLCLRPLFGLLSRDVDLEPTYRKVIVARAARKNRKDTP